MIAMSMQSGGNINIIIEKIFLANRIVPLAIQKDDKNDRSYKILFKLNETISDNSIYFETRLLCEDDLDISYIESRSIFIDNLKKDENKFKAFKEMMKEFDSNKFYAGDFKFTFENMNYKFIGYKEMTDKSGKPVYESMKIYIPRYMFIIISLYMEDFMNPYNVIEKEFLFVSNDMLSMRFEKVENVKLVASSKYKENNVFHYTTMYELNCGPTFWKFNYDIITEEDLELKEPLDYSIFEPEYSQYNEKLIGIVEDKEFIYVITTNSNNKVVALKLTPELIDKTNFKDPYFIFNYTEDEEIEEESSEEDKEGIINE